MTPGWPRLDVSIASSGELPNCAVGQSLKISSFVCSGPATTSSVLKPGFWQWAGSVVWRQPPSGNSSSPLNVGVLRPPSDGSSPQ